MIMTRSSRRLLDLIMFWKQCVSTQIVTVVEQIFLFLVKTALRPCIFRADGSKEELATDDQIYTSI